MGFYQDYELLGLVHDGPTKTLRAREIAVDRQVFLHLLTGALTPDAQQSLLERIEELSGRTAEVLRVGEFAGTRFAVTEVLDPFSNLEQWVAERINDQAADRGTECGNRGASPRMGGPGEPAGTRIPGSGSSPRVLPAQPVPNEVRPAEPVAEVSPIPTAGSDSAPRVTTRTYPATSVGNGQLGALDSSRKEWQTPSGAPITALADAPSTGGRDASAHDTSDDALRSALETLETALKLRPGDPEVLRLVDQAKRLNHGQAAEELQAQRDWHYQRARQHWELGDLEAARAEMDRLFGVAEEPVETDSGNGYREFQRQVEAEIKTLASSYDEARAQVAEEHLDEALAICDRYLARHPNHSSFRALKFDIGERRRREGVSIVIEIESRVSAEPDLDRKIEILEEALSRRPDEKHFEEEIRLLQEKQQLVGSLIDKANSLEQSQRYREALGQWQLVESVYQHQPGLQTAIHGLQQLIEGQRVRQEARERHVSQAKRCLREGDAEQALRVVREALADCPDDAELRRIESEALESQHRVETVRNNLRQAQLLWKSGRRSEALDLLRQGYQLDPRNALARGELVNALIEQARHQIDSDWASAEPLIEEALKLEPTHKAVAQLSEQIRQQRREELVSWCLVEARRLRAQGDLPAAHRVVSESLQQYPEEDRLLQLETALARALGRPETPRVAPEPKNLADERPADEAQYEPIAPSESDTNAPAGQAGPTETLPNGRRSLRQARVETEEDLLSRLANESGSSARQGNAHAEKVAPQPTKTSTWTSWKEKYETAASRRRIAGKGEAPAGKTKVVASRRVAVAIAFVAVAGIVLAWMFLSNGPLAPTAANFLVAIESSPPGATLVVDGQVCGSSTCEVELSAAQHRVEARLAGYQPAAVLFEVREDGAPQPIVVTLLPQPAALHISSDLASGEVTLDGKRIGMLEDGALEWEMSELGRGEHILRLTSSGASTTMTFEAPAGSPPRFTAPLRASSLKAIVVASLGSTAHLFGTERGAPVRLDGQPAGELGPEALVLKNLSEGSHELTLGSGGDEREIVFDSTETPTLAVFLDSDRNVGSLRVTTGEDDVTIFLNGTEYRRKTSRGRSLIFLYPKQYEVRVGKEGFRTPAVQTAEIRKGGEVRLEFEMTPLPQTAALRITNGLGGTDVWIDGQWRGVIRSGVFTLPSVPPGRHVIRLERANYKTVEIEREFEPNATIEVDGVLESALGALEIQVDPSVSDVRLTLEREGESAPRAISERSLQLPPGIYSVRASAPGFHDSASTVRVAADQTRTAVLTLRRREEKKASRPVVTLADWEKAGWQREGELIVRRGGDFLLAANSGGAGRYTFTALLQRGRRLEWVVNYADANNYVFYQLGKDFLHRTVIAGGKRSRIIKIPHQMKWDDLLSVDLAVREDSIVHRLLVGGDWIELDNWRQPGGNFTGGKFGFHIPGRDQVGLSQFAFVPEL